MRKAVVARAAALAAGVVFLGAGLAAQATATLKVSVLIVDADLNVKPVPRHVLMVRRADGAGDPQRLVMGFDGKAELKLAPGNYTLESEKPVEFQGHAYHWKQPVTVAAGATPTSVELSIDNAVDDLAPARMGTTPPPAAKPAPPPPPPPVPTIPDLRGTWMGTYADLPDAKLVIDRQDGTTFSGTLSVVTRPGKAASDIQVDGKLTDHLIDLTETKVLNLGGAQSWGLGSGSGTLQADGKQMSGTGLDAKSSYKWTYKRDTNPGGIPAVSAAATSAVSAVRAASALPDVRGSWTGSYAGSPAELKIDTQDDATWSGTLLVTTRPGKDPTEIQMSGKVSPTSIDLAEVKMIKTGGAGGWKLGSGSGTFQQDGRQMSGQTRDDKSAYDFSFERRGQAPPPMAGRAAAPPASVAPPASTADLRGSWDGVYAGSPAELKIDTHDGAIWSGTLLVTTKAGKDPTEIQVSGRLSGMSLDIRETSILRAGAVSNWKLGSGSGTLQADGHTMNGSGTDGKTSYKFSFAKR
jgi:hypothetical protein